MWSPAVHLRKSPRVCLHLTEKECRVLWDSLRATANTDEIHTQARDALHRAPMKAEKMFRIIEPIEDKWVTLSNEQLWLCWHSLFQDEMFDMDLNGRIIESTRPIERVDRAANSTGYRGPEWDDQRREVQERADGGCEFCHTTGLRLDTHHRIPCRRFNTFQEAHNTKNLVAVCPSCHGRTESAGYIDKEELIPA